MTEVQYTAVFGESLWENLNKVTGHAPEPLSLLPLHAKEEGSHLDTTPSLSPPNTNSSINI
jgi:predicted metal-dependent hydrolase